MVIRGLQDFLILTTDNTDVYGLQVVLKGIKQFLRTNILPKDQIVTICDNVREQWLKK